MVWWNMIIWTMSNVWKDWQEDSFLTEISNKHAMHNNMIIYVYMYIYIQDYTGIYRISQEISKQSRVRPGSSPKEVGASSQVPWSDVMQQPLPLALGELVAPPLERTWYRGWWHCTKLIHEKLPAKESKGKVLFPQHARIGKWPLEIFRMG